MEQEQQLGVELGASAACPSWRMMRSSSVSTCDMPGLSGNFQASCGSAESGTYITGLNQTCTGVLQTSSGHTQTGTAQMQQVQQRFPGPVMSSPSLDVITSSQELRWLLQSSLWTQPDSSWQTLASCVPLEEPTSRPDAAVPGCCLARSRHPGATDRTRTKVTGRLDDNKLSQEERERRRLRRERNRMAAAKCRNRRRVLTDTLQNESDQLESTQSQLQEEIAQLERQKEKLELVLEAHRPLCKIAHHSDGHNDDADDDDDDDDDDNTGCL
ncbi:hypothetical protein ACEWY4_009439 [Coilia grayii]|uniref:BZIP domain-containing protein n=1 Tax=Coilia grayii TaxID=363190 RepID=A0ABD1K6H6_9TELE